MQPLWKDVRRAVTTRVPSCELYSTVQLDRGHTVCEMLNATMGIMPGIDSRSWIGMEQLLKQSMRSGDGHGPMPF